MTVAVVLAGTLLGGWLQGRMTSGWGADGQLAAAGKRLDAPLGEHIGNWRLLHKSEFPADVVRMLQCPAHVSRTYIHQQTGDTVSVDVIVGPPGPISVHTPEICYSSQDFVISSERTPITVADRTNGEHTLWQVSLEPREGSAPPQRVLYAWGNGTAWTATGDPRFAHAGEPYLYKIQLAGPPADEAAEFDPCHDFLQSFLPEVQKHLVPTRPTVRHSDPQS